MHTLNARALRTLLFDHDSRAGDLTPLLRQHGHTVKSCDSIAHALAFIAQQSLELIVIGAWTDSASAREAVSVLRAATEGRHTVLALLVPADCRLSAAELIDCGADEIITLPLNAPPAHDRLARIERSIRKQHELERLQVLVRESDERLQTITDHAPVFFRMTAPDGLATYFNRAWLAFTGRSLERELGYGWSELIRPDQRELALDTMLSGIKEQAAFRIEYQLRRHDGQYRWFTETGTPRRDAAGIFHGYVSSCTDITELKQSEEALRRAEEKYRSIFENAVEGIFQTTPDGRYLNANSALARIYGYTSPEELMGRLTDIAHQLYVRKGRREEFVHLLRTNSIVENFESQIFRRDGSVIWITENARAVRDSAGRVLYYEGTVEDITEHKRTAEQLRLMEAAVVHAQDAVMVLEATQSDVGDRHIVYVNQAFSRLTGYAAGEVIDCSPSILNGRQTDAKVVEQLGLALADARPFCTEMIQYRKDGSEYWADIQIAPIYDGARRVTHFVSLQRDATTRKRTEEALRESEARYELAANGANDGLWDWDLQTGRVYFSPRWKMMLGLHATEMTDSSEEWISRVHKDDLDAVREQLSEHFEGRVHTFRCEFRMRHADGTYRWMISRGLAVRGDDGIALRMAGSQTDISARKLAELQLEHDAYHDTLTGLPNRALLMDRLRQAIRRSKRRPDYRFVLLFLDLDRFKLINDSLGHQAGDQLLISLARRLEICLRPTDTVARLGGDEFVVLLDDLRDTDAETVAGRIRQELNSPFRIEGRDVFISASIGITHGTSDLERAEDMLREADTAMYRAKSSGKNRHETYETSMHLQAVSTLHMETALRRALERDELFLEYQPIISLLDRRVTGFEALVRWRHPDRGLVSPGAFIPLAEENGLIAPITEWVLRTACRQLADWTATLKPSGRVSMSVNISGWSCSNSEVPTLVSDVLKQTGVAPECLRLEITESSFVERAEQTDAFFREMKKLNVKLAIDDFGTGYSSLSYFHRMPADAVKVDRSFVRDMLIAEKNQEIIRAVIALARSTNMEVVAEGVETAAQLQKLTELRCDSAQGFLFSRAVEADAAAKMIGTKF